MKILSSLFKKIFTVLCAFTLLASPFSLADTQPTEKTETPPQKELILAEKVNLNTATVETLSTILSGIGEKKAQAIVDYREQHGKFTAIEQITEVKGIGEAIFEKNKDRLTL